MTHNPLILSVETSGRTGSVALAKGTKILENHCFTGPMKHSAELFPAMIQMLKNHNYTPPQVEQVYISIGPGSFTGLRIAATMAKIMHLANNNLKIVAVDTLDVIALNADRTSDCGIDRIAVILDAKRGSFFVAAYQKTNQGWKKILDDCLLTAKQFTDKFDNTEPIWLLGEGLVYYSDIFSTDNIKIMDEKLWYPSAENLHKIGFDKASQGLFADPQTLTPAYLSRPQAIRKQF